MWGNEARDKVGWGGEGRNRDAGGKRGSWEAGEKAGMVVCVRVSVRKCECVQACGRIVSVREAVSPWVSMSGVQVWV